MSVALRRIKALLTSLIKGRGPLQGPSYAQGTVYHVVNSEMTFEKVMAREVEELERQKLPIQEHRDRLAELKMKYLEIAVEQGWLIEQ